MKLNDDYPKAYADMLRMTMVLAPDKLAEFIRLVGVDKVMWGSDYPSRNPVEDVQKINALGISDEAKRAILGENAMRFFGLIRSKWVL